MNKRTYHLIGLIAGLVIFASLGWITSSLTASSDILPLQITEDERLPIYVMFLERQMVIANMQPLQVQYNSLTQRMDAEVKRLYEKYDLDPTAFQLDAATGEFVLLESAIPGLIEAAQP